MTILRIGLCAVLFSVCALPSNASAVEVKSKASEIKLTGQVHTQFNTSSVEGELGSEFLVRRVRLTAEVKLNDFVSGKVQPDYGSGKLTLKDAYMKLTCGPNLGFRLGQFKRPFDLFELTSSTKILVVERALKIRGVGGMRSLSSLTEKLGYSDRDVGVEMSVSGREGRLRLVAAVTNGTGANHVPSKTDGAVSEKQYTGRFSMKPMKNEALTVSVAGSFRPYVLPEEDSAAVMGADEPEVEYAKAVQADMEWGDWKSGPHVQAGAVWGENWDAWGAGETEAPRFTAAQLIGAWKFGVDDNRYVEAVEPLIRVSYADPDGDTADDGGVLVTPGVQFFFAGRNKVALNVDIFLPEADGEETEYSIKAQSSVHF